MCIESRQRSTWEAERSWLNHHRLKNQFENSADAFAVLLKQPNAAVVAAERFMALKAAWSSLHGQIERLLARYRREAGPNRFFELAPLKDLEPPVREWLREVTAAMWWVRVNGESLVFVARAKLEGVSEAMAELDLGLRRDGSAPSGGVVCNAAAKAAEAFATAVHELSVVLGDIKKRSYIDT